MVKGGRYLWRLLMTGVCFALFGLGGLCLSLIGFRLLGWVERDALARRRLARRLVSASFRLFLASARRMGVLNYHIDGAALLQAERGVLVVANHPTLIDYVLLASVMPEADCLVKRGLQENLFLRGVVQAAGYLVNRDADTLLPDCRQRLAQGDVIIIFPEGTRSLPGQPLTLQRGAANLAVRCGCDLRIVHIRCSQHTLGKHQRWYQIPPEKPYFSVSVKARLSSQPFLQGEIALPLAARRVNHTLTRALTAAYSSPLENTMDTLSQEIKQLIIDTLNLEEVSVEEIDTQAPLFGDGLGLDSIDALELGLAIKNRYHVVLSTESEEMRDHFFSVATLARFINQQHAATGAAQDE